MASVFFEDFLKDASLRMKKLGTLAPGHSRRVMTGVRIIAALKLLPPP